MLTRRELLKRSLQGTSLLALGSTVPEFVARTALAAEANKDTILVVIELNGGNDGLNTVIPHGDDLYHKYRPTLKFTKDQVVKVSDHIGLHPAMRSLEQHLPQLAIVQGVGYPNPDRSHFESMDIWQMADPKRKVNTGWLGRSGSQLHTGGIAMMHVGPGKLPMALTHAGGGAISVNHRQPYRLELGGGDGKQQKARLDLLNELAKVDEEADPTLQFVQRRQVQTLSTLDRLQEFLRNRQNSNVQYQTIYGRQYPEKSLPMKLDMVAHLIQRDFGTRVFYVMRDDFDTHSNQAETHRNLLGELADGISFMYQTLKQSGNEKRVRVMTFSEFGRRVQENGSKGTDHGSGSCLFVCGEGIKGGLVGEHPSLKAEDLADGDLKYHTDFRRVYATLLDTWLGCNSETVLNAKFEHLPTLAGKG
jgi:uncharacterized protein (DUF1501 family)